jgi:hypothetical protein
MPAPPRICGARDLRLRVFGLGTILHWAIPIGTRSAPSYSGMRRR